MISQKEAIDNYHEIKAFVKGTIAENAPVIPVSSQKGINIGALVQALDQIIPEPVRIPNRQAGDAHSPFIRCEQTRSATGKMSKAVSSGVSYPGHPPRR